MRRRSGGNWALEKYNPFPRRDGNRPRQQGLRGRVWDGPDAEGPRLARENAMAVKFDVPLTQESGCSAQEQLSGNFDLGSARYGSAQSIADRRVRFRPMDYLTKQLG